MGIIEKDIEKISIGQDVTLTVETFPGRKFSGKIANIAPGVVGRSRTLPAQALFENKEELLKPGMFARCHVAVFSSSNTLVVPVTSINTQEGSSPHVFVVDADNRVQVRPVKTGHISHSYAQITEGLKDGDLIVAEAGESVKSGIEIEPITTHSYDPTSGKTVEATGIEKILEKQAPPSPQEDEIY